MATPSYNSTSVTDRWHRFSAFTVRAFHRYGTWLTTLSWWRFGWYSLLLLIATGLIQSQLFTWSYTETVTDSSGHHVKRKERAKAAPAPAAPVSPAAPVAPAAPAAPPVPTPAPTPPVMHIEKAPAASGAESKTVDINLPGIVVNTKDHSVKNHGVNISFSENGIHISTDDDATPHRTEDASAANANASIASAAQALAQGAREKAAAAREAAHAARDAARAARDTAHARRDAARISAASQAQASADAQAQAQAQASADATAAQAEAARAAASAAAATAAESAVDIVVGGQHIRIGVPSHANSDEVRDAINEAKDSIVESIRDAEQAKADAAQAARDAAQEKADAQASSNDDEDGDPSDGHSTVRTHTMHYGEMLPLMAAWWILGSMLLKITYKGRILAEVKAAVATETAEAESLRRQVLEAKMAMMQAQVEPHFLFNTLASIDHLIEFDPKRASQMQRNLISLLRASMPSMRASTETGLRPLDLELAVVRPYLEILKVRMEERLTTDIDVPDGLLSAEFPPMMIQTLVENSIKHGLEPKAEGGHLAVKAEIRHGKLCVTVSDTGLGFGHANPETAGTGVGLANIRERLALLYGAKSTLTIANNPAGGTIVTITVPYTAHTDEGASA